MTPTAEELANDFLSLIDPVLVEDKEHLILLFKQASQESYERGFKDGDRCTAQSIAKARNESLEEAARVIMNIVTTEQGLDALKQGARSIRNLKREVK